MINDDLCAVHRTLSQAHEQFMEHVCANKERVLPFDRTGLLPDAFVYPMNAWPFLVDEAFRREVVEATEKVMKLVRLIPDRLFGEDLGACGAFFGYPDPALSKLIFSQPNGMDTVMARPDFLLTAQGFKCLETNVSPNIGGWFTFLWMEAYMARPFIKEFMDSHNLKPVYKNPALQFFRFLTDLGLQRSLFQDACLNIALVLPEQQENAPQTIARLQFLADQYTAAYQPDLRLRFFHPKNYDAVVIEDGRATVVGEPVAVIIEADDSLTPVHVMELFKAGGVVLLNGPTHFMMTDKRALALLSQNVESDRFSAEERSWIERYIPWSRILKEGPVLFRGERADLVSLLKSQPKQFVLKAGLGCQGQEVLVGNKADQVFWEAAIDQAVVEGGWMVQEFLKSVSALGMGEDGVICPHDLIWGFFSFGEQFSGSFLRIQKTEFGRGVINSANGAQETLMLFV